MSKIGPIAPIGGKDLVPMGMVSVLIFIFMAVSVFLFLLIVCSPKLRQNRVNWLVANFGATCVIFGAVVRPIDIHYMVGNTELPHMYCVLATLIHKMEIVVVPVAHFLFTSERLVFAAQTKVHGSALRSAGATTTLVVTPWILGLVVATVTHFAEESTLVTTRQEEENVGWGYTDWPVCHLSSPNRVIYAYYIPLVMLVVSTAGLVIVYFCRKRVRRSIISEEMETYIRACVIMALLANCVFLVMLTPRAIMGENYRSLEPWMYSFVEFFTGMLALVCLPDLRVMTKRCLKCDRGEQTPEN